MSSLHNHISTTTPLAHSHPSTVPHPSLPNRPFHLHQHPPLSSHNSMSQDASNTEISSTNDITESGSSFIGAVRNQWELGNCISLLTLAYLLL